MKFDCIERKDRDAAWKLFWRHMFSRRLTSQKGTLLSDTSLHVKYGSTPPPHRGNHVDSKARHRNILVKRWSAWADLRRLEEGKLTDGFQLLLIIWWNRSDDPLVLWVLSIVSTQCPFRSQGPCPVRFLQHAGNTAWNASWEMTEEITDVRVMTH